MQENIVWRATLVTMELIEESMSRVKIVWVLCVCVCACVCVCVCVCVGGGGSQDNLLLVHNG